ncbi:MAG: 4a-hydroxytetrahydrobiopterin dehydratase [Solirubrobacteraceae bacterium]
MTDKLSDDAVADGIAGTDWTRDGDAIVRDLELGDFAAAVAYVNRVADAAEEADHHPDILVHGWSKVRLTLSTHSVGGLTQADLDMARTLESVPR